MRRLAFFQNDNVHPSVDGVNALAKYLCQFITTNSIDVHEMCTTVLTDGATYTVSSQKGAQMQHNDKVTFFNNLGGTFASLAGALTAAQGFSAVSAAVNVGDGFFYGKNQDLFVNGVLFKGTDSATLEIVPDNIGLNKAVTLSLYIFAPAAISVSDFNLWLGSATFKIPY